MKQSDYCDACGVSLDLHPEDVSPEVACGVAARKAETLAAFSTRLGHATTHATREVYGR